MQGIIRFPASFYNLSNYKMSVVQNKKSYFRSFSDFGYVFNQETNSDQVFDEIGSIFLKSISRTPREIDSCINKIKEYFEDVSYDELKNDFNEFLALLIDGNNITINENIGELHNSQTTKPLEQLTTSNKYRFSNTSDFFLEKVKTNPILLNAEIELTNKCNEKCIHCYIPPSAQNKNIDSKLAFEIIDQLSEMGTLFLTFTGGEIFLHKDIYKILEYADQKDFSITLLSNSTLLNNDMINFLGKIKIKLFRTTVFSLNEDIHDSITRKKDSLKNTLKNINLLMQENVPIQISLPVIKQNYKSVLKVYQWAYNNNIDVISDFTIIARSDFDKGNLDFRINSDELRYTLNDLSVIKNDLRRKNNFDNIKPLVTSSICRAGLTSICFTSTGNVIPCSGFYGYPVGNIYKQNIMNIWPNSESLKTLREINYSYFPQCINCEESSYCKICLMKNYNETNGNLYKINSHYCSIALEIKNFFED